MTRSALLLALLLPLAACGSDDTPEADGSIADAANAIEALPASDGTNASPAGGATVVDMVADARDLTTLRRLLRETGLVDELAAEGPYTLFAPSDDAFAAIDLDAASSDMEALKATLRSHVLPIRMLSGDLDFEQSIEAASGAVLDVVPGSPPAVASGGVRATVLRADLDATNGVVHVVDAVLSAN
ncbi:fasciclin domain-containing protein [Rubricoccus marinus]|uniref:FAS1 domain-containing protein n=1 Tax=Rubricoccus marinus TaxID=716817 RepID=A0A259TZI9_9BACT|nr:fasciclin domain-containing protein [Rubricoccus marinus]OZC03193.1 hypothetical protein BSZ36_09535 [Rubricoccus marinus]